MLTSDLGDVGTSFYRLVAEFDGDLVLAGCGWQIGHRHGTIFIIVTGYVSLARSLDGEGEATSACTLRRDHKVTGLTAYAVDEARTVSRNISTRERVHVELEWRTCVQVTNV